MAKHTIRKSDLLPAWYKPMQEPYFKGNGIHSVSELESICTDYKELVHQLQLTQQSIFHIFDIEVIL